MVYTKLQTRVGLALVDNNNRDVFRDVHGERNAERTPTTIEPESLTSSAETLRFRRPVGRPITNYGYRYRRRTTNTVLVITGRKTRWVIEYLTRSEHTHTQHTFKKSIQPPRLAPPSRFTDFYPVVLPNSRPYRTRRNFRRTGQGKPNETNLGPTVSPWSGLKRRRRAASEQCVTITPKTTVT